MTGQDNPTPSNPPPPPNPFAAREPSPRARNTDSVPPTGYPVFELSVEASREVDRIAVDDFGILGIALMENAAAALRRNAVEMLDGLPNPCVEIFCGPGNNAGDGFALARHLSNQRIPVSVRLLIDPERYTGDARTNLGIIQRMGLPINADAPPVPGGLLIDAVFGTGLSRSPAGEGAEMTRTINQLRDAGSRALSVDLPSGLDAQSGIPMTPCVVADRTVTLAALKAGFTNLSAQRVLGRVVVEDIGVPIQILEKLGRRLHAAPGLLGTDP